jgi:hypothetical protein
VSSSSASAATAARMAKSRLPPVRFVRVWRACDAAGGVPHGAGREARAAPGCCSTNRERRGGARFGMRRADAIGTSHPSRLQFVQKCKGATPSTAPAPLNQRRAPRQPRAAPCTRTRRTRCAPRHLPLCRAAARAPAASAPPLPPRRHRRRAARERHAAPPSCSPPARHARTRFYTQTHAAAADARALVPITSPAAWRRCVRCARRRAAPRRPHAPPRQLRRDVRALVQCVGQPVLCGAGARQQHGRSCAPLLAQTPTDFPSCGRAHIDRPRLAAPLRSL